MSGFISYIMNNYQTIIDLTIEHIQLTLVAIGIAIIIGIPLGILISFVKPVKKPIMAFANLVQAIPSMALLGFMIPLLGIGTKPAIVMVVLYSLLPIVRNTYTGIQNVNSDTLEAAKGIGLTKFQVLYKIQFPLALPVIMAGVRTSAVTSVGTMTLAAFIGAGGLGYMVYAGIRTVNTFQILAGAIPACLLALFIDYLFGILETYVTPKSFQLHNPESKIKKLMNKVVIIITIVALLFTLVYKMDFGSDSYTITIGSMDFTEQEVLSYMINDLIEENSDIEVNQKLSLGSSGVVLDAINNNDIDMYIDYTGTIYGSVFQLPSNSNTKEVYNTFKEKMLDEYNLTVLDTLGFNNTYTLATTKEIADRFNLKTITDLSRVSNDLILSPTLTFMEREDCLKGLVNTYAINFKDVIGIDGSPRYTALENGNCDIIDAYSTDGLLKKYDLVVLEDDKGSFPPYDAIPVINETIRKDCPEVVKLLNSLSKYLDESVMVDLNYQVDVLQKKSSDVAHDFLVKQGLIK